MGYTRAPEIIATVRGWHHGRYPAVRSARARELLTEVQPALIEALAETANPDLAFIGFDRFLSELPSGVQLFSLLKQNPSLLELIAAIMGTAPRLARILSKRRRVLDAVLDPGFFGSLPDRGELDALIAAEFEGAPPTSRRCSIARASSANEQQFLIGVRVLTGTISRGAGRRRLRAAGRVHDRGHAGRGRARDGARARPRAGRRRGGRRHGQARRARDDGRLRSRPHPHLRLRPGGDAVERAQAAAPSRSTTRATPSA